MPGRVSQYSASFNEELRGKIICILAEAERPLTASEIISRDISLTGLTTQKVSHTIADLIEYGVCCKGRRDNYTTYMTMEMNEKLMSHYSYT